MKDKSGDAIFALHLQLVKNASRWKAEVPALDIGRVSKLRRALLEDGGPAYELGLQCAKDERDVTNNSSRLTFSLEQGVKRWNALEINVLEALSYIRSLPGTVMGEFVHLWRDFSVGFACALKSPEAWEKLAMECERKSGAALRFEKARLLKQFIQEDVEWGDRHNTFSSPCTSSTAKEQEVFNMDIELLLNVAQQRLDNVNTISAAANPLEKSWSGEVTVLRRTFSTMATSTDDLKLYASSSKYGAASKAGGEDNVRTVAVNIAKYPHAKGKLRKRCKECKDWISVKAGTQVANCCALRCGAAFHLRCVQGGRLQKVPKSWVCEACMQSKMVVEEEEKEEEKGRGEEETSSDEDNSVEAKRQRFSRKRHSSSSSMSSSSSKRGRKAISERAVARLTRTASTESMDSVRRTSSIKNTRKAAAGSVVPPSRQSPHQTTVVDLVQAGYLKKGDRVTVPYLNQYSWEGMINASGLVEFEGLEFYSPPSLALFCKRKIYPSKQSDRGWTSVFHGSTPLLEYRNKLYAEVKEKKSGWVKQSQNLKNVNKVYP